MAWLVRGSVLWQHEGLSEPSEVVSATADYRAESNWLERFIEEDLHFAEGVWSSSSRLADALQQFCRENGVEHGTPGELHTRLRQEGCTPKKCQGQRGWSGVSIVEVTEDGVV